MIIELKNAIKNAILAKIPEISFYFEEIKPKVHYPYCFFYISNYTPLKYNDKTDVSLLCVLEYQLSENNSNADLWGAVDTIQDALMPCFGFLDGKIFPESAQFRIIENVLQVNFNLNFTSTKYDTIELMKELDLTLNNAYQVTYTSEEV